MAIDTAAKRRAVAGLLGYVLGPGVTPSATPDAAWRQTVGYGYLGIAAVAEGARVHHDAWTGLSGLALTPMPAPWWWEESAHELG